MEFKNILVAVDFTDTVGELLTYAESLAEKYQAKIWIVHVAEPHPDFVGYEPGPQFIRDIKAEELNEDHRNLQVICEAFVNKDIESEALLIQGSTVQVIIDEVKKLKADLLIAGTHKHGLLYNLLAESVSLELLKKAEIPFLSIPISE